MTGKPLDLNALDRILAELKERFPGWRLWYVPHHYDKTVTWCGHPWPVINAQSPEHLAAEIRQAHAEAAGDWPALRQDAP